MALPDWSDARLQAAAPILNDGILAYDLPAAIVYGLVAHESGFNPSAFLMDRNGGSIGLMQISLPTARGMGYQGDAAGLYDPATNVTYGLAYFRAQLDRYSGDVAKALSAYNAGRAITGNAAYVNDILARAAYFDQFFSPPPAPTGDGTGEDISGGTTTPTGSGSGLLVALAAVVLVGWLLTKGGGE